jgi:hypothetical protein
MTEPDPELHPDRRKVWVYKSINPKPEPLAMTIGVHGCDYDDMPPTEPDKKESEKRAELGPRNKTREWLTAKVQERSRLGCKARWTDLAKEWKKLGRVESTLRMSRDCMIAEKILLMTGSKTDLQLSMP